MKKIKKAIIPAAGLGTRFLPITKSIPKEMLPIIDKPTIQYIVEECIESGIEKIMFIVRSNKNMIKDYFEKNLELEKLIIEKRKIEQLNKIDNIIDNIEISYTIQDKPLGSGHAINLARDFIGNEPFAILYADNIFDSKIPVLKQLIEVYEKYNCNVIGVQEVPNNLVNKYGILKFKDNNSSEIDSIIEKPDFKNTPSNMASLGRYIVKPEIFDELDNIKMANNGEYLFTDALLELMNKQAFHACKLDGKYYDIGNQMGYLKANIDYALKRDELVDDLKDFIKNLY